LQQDFQFKQKVYMNNAVQKQEISIQDYIANVTSRATEVCPEIAATSTDKKNQALKFIAEEILNASARLKQQNALDLQAGKKRGLASALLDRLELTDARIQAMAEGLLQVSSLTDPVGETTAMVTRPSGIQVGKMRVPIGVILIIYESRPNVTADAAALCIKSGNVTILRGGSEALNSNQAIADCIHAGLDKAGLSKDIVQVISTTDRAAVIKHLDGVCHVYIHEDADIEMATEIAVNAKAQRFGVCNAMETLLIDKNIAKEVLPKLQKRFDEKNVELRGCKETCEILENISAASEEDWYTEYLGPILSVKVVDGISQAMHHIEKYGSHHTDSIVTNNQAIAQQFLREVDSSSVMINASTRFADGFEYGLGAEIGISTDKLHARGPVGLEGLTTQKFIVLGDGNIRE
jgi:glutamate-5-semialdehyde dehydrogenase